jgi:cytochrome c-type biogenesis protein
LESVGILIALASGFISFISPCVLPIVPGYVSFISGVSFEEMQNAENRAAIRKRTAFTSAMFVLGFSIVFIALGASATFVGQFLQQQLALISKIAGAIIIVLGLHMIGVFKIPFLNYEKRFTTAARPLGAAGAVVVGMAFAFGWTPCIGPILASILAIASQQDSVWKGMLLLSAYSLGLGIPFIITGLSITVFYNAFNRFKKHLHTVEVVGGVLLVVIGILIMTNYLTLISAALAEWFPFLNEIG